MSCEGVWRVEMMGPYGWESIATAFMKDGQYFEASANHYTVGTYKVDGDKLEISDATTQYGASRTLLGTNFMEKMPTKSRCDIKENEITGTTRAKDIESHEIRIRLTRLESI